MKNDYIYLDIRGLSGLALTVLCKYVETELGKAGITWPINCRPGIINEMEGHSYMVVYPSERRLYRGCAATPLLNSENNVFSATKNLTGFLEATTVRNVSLSVQFDVKMNASGWSINVEQLTQKANELARIEFESNKK